jgi:hypothetical protein
LKFAHDGLGDFSPRYAILTRKPFRFLNFRFRFLSSRGKIVGKEASLLANLPGNLSKIGLQYRLTEFWESGNTSE